MSKIKVKSLSMNETAVFSAIKQHLLTALRNNEQQLLSLMQKEVLETTYGDAPGKPRWRDELRDSLSILEEQITDEYMNVSVGADVQENTYKFVRAMLITYGSGSRVGNGSIEAGPTGRIVWTEDLDGQQASRAEGNYLLPLEFNQRGNKFIDNAVQLMQKFWNDTLDNAMATLPESIFCENITTVQN